MLSRLEEHLKIIVFFIVASAVVFFMHSNWQTLQRPFSHDEVDYVVCAEKGVWHNAVGTETLSLKEFITLGKLKKNKDSLGIVAYAAGLADPNEDVFVLRHYHPPLPVYFWSLFNIDDISKHQTALRISNWLLLLFSGIVLVVLFKNWSPTSGVFVGLVFAIFLSSDLTAYAFSSLNFHTFLGFFSLIFLFALLRYLEDRSRKNQVLLSLSIALMLLSLESAVFVIGLAFIAIVITGSWRKFTFKSLGFIVGLSLLITTVFWPAFLLKGELIKSIGMYVSRIFVNENLEYNEVSYLQNWLEVIKLAPIIFVLFLVGQVLVVQEFLQTKIKSTLIPFIIGWGYCLLMTPFILNKTYIMPGIFVLVFATIHAMVITKKSRQLIFVILGFGLVSVVYLGFSEENKWFKAEEGKEFRTQVAQVEELAESGKVLIFPGHIFQYYAQDAAIESLGHPKINYYGFTHRYDYKRADISEKIAAGYYAYIIIPVDDRYQNWYAQLEEMGMHSSEKVTGYKSYSFIPD